MNPKSKAFKELQKLWYSKLAESGFEDIEKNEHELHKYTTGLVANHKEVEAYYIQLYHYLLDGEFDNKVDEAIWYLFSTGSTLREISRSLTLSRYRVTSTIEKHLDIMKKAARNG